MKMLKNLRNRMKKSFMVLGTAFALLGSIGTTFSTAVPVSAAETVQNVTSAAVTSSSQVSSKVKYTGKKTDHKVTYTVCYNKTTKILTLKIKNNSQSTIQLGWVNDFYVTFKGSKGAKNISFDTLKCIQYGGLQFNKIQPGKTAVYKCKVNLGTPKKIIIKNVYPLSSSGLPTYTEAKFNRDTWSYSMPETIKYSLCINLK